VNESTAPVYVKVWLPVGGTTRVVESGADVAAQPSMFVVVTVKVSELVTRMDCVVAPVDQR
jgi:hypothetical protein